MEGADTPSEELVVISRFMGATLGEAEVEISGWMGGWIRAGRLRSVAKVIRTTERILDEAGIEPKRVPHKTISALLEGASLEEEDEDEMIARWANLLARASNDEDVPSSYARTLAQITPNQARLLKSMWTDETARQSVGVRADTVAIYVGPTALDGPSLADLERLGLVLIQPHEEPRAQKRGITHGSLRVELTSYGAALVHLCSSGPSQPEKLGKTYGDLHPRFTVARSRRREDSSETD